MEESNGVELKDREYIFHRLFDTVKILLSVGFVILKKPYQLY